MSVAVNGIGFTGNECRVVTATWNGRTFTAGERTWAHLFATQEWLDKNHPGWYIYVLQGAYNTTVEASAGSHDKDGALDFLIIHRTSGARSWVRGQRWVRSQGWADWWRHTGSWHSPSSWHHHGISLGVIEAGCPTGFLIPDQVGDYLATPPRNGLADNARDFSWHPKNISATVFNYDRWLRQKEDEMGYAQWPKADKDAFWEDFAKRGAPAVWNEGVNTVDAGGDAAFRGMTFRSWAKDVWKTVKGGK